MGGTQGLLLPCRPACVLFTTVCALCLPAFAQPAVVEAEEASPELNQPGAVETEGVPEAELPATAEADEAQPEDQGAVGIINDERGIVLPLLLDLPEAERVALMGNPSLKAALARVDQAQARIRQARSEWYPFVDSSLSASFTELPDRDIDAARNAIYLRELAGLGGIFQQPNLDFLGLAQGALGVRQGIREGLAAIDDTQETWQAGLGFTWLLFDGFGRKFRIAVARYNEQEFEAAFLESQRLLLSAVASAFYNVQLSRENIQIAQADREFNERQLKEAEARRRVGTGSLSDVLNFEVRVKAAQSELLRAERNYNVALIALMELMGVPGAVVPPGFEVAELYSELPEEMVVPDVDALVDTAYLQRPDRLQALLAEDRLDATVKIRRSEFFPQVAVFGSTDAVRNDAEFRSDDFSSTIGVGVTFDIFTGGLRRARVSEARAAVSEANWNLETVELEIASDVQQRLADLRTAQLELILQRETTELVERNRELVEKGYRAGQESLVRLNEAQRDLIAQQSQLALARVALRQFWHDLRTATAETLDPYYDFELAERILGEEALQLEPVEDEIAPLADNTDPNQ